MADIFISYSKAERRLTEELAQELEAHGYSVWWDTNLVAGDHFQKAIVAELEAARAVIVIWTPSSTQSEWVYSEANRAARRNKLIPVRLTVVDIYDIPPPYDVRQTDLLHNRKAIYAALARLGVRPPAAEPQPVPQPAVTMPTTTPIRPAPAAPEANLRQADAALDAAREKPVPASVSQPAPVAPVPEPSAVMVKPIRSPETRTLSAARVLHWTRTRRLAGAVLAVWSVIALAVHLGASSLNQFLVMGFPLGFYLAAQGSLIGFLALLGWFVLRQNRIDRAVAHGEVR